MYAGAIEMTIQDRLALSPVENAPIPVLFSEENNAWIISTRDAFYFHCDCHDLVWNSNEMFPIDLEDGRNAFWRCDLPLV